jgi:hypothetical protein
MVIADLFQTHSGTQKKRFGFYIHRREQIEVGILLQYIYILPLLG